MKILIKTRAFLLLVVLIGTLIFSCSVSIASEVPNDQSICADLVLLFARGSSQNQSSQFLNFPFGGDFKEIEQESGRFFETFKAQLDSSYPNVKYKAHSVHDFPGLYNHDGYKAVSIFKSGMPWLSPNALNAEFSWFSGDYRESVANGADEVAGFVKHQKALCADQRIIMGGYSQGAHVIGEALFKLTEQERENISGVALFGDPKFYADNKPWKRGTASDKDRGLADARIPYLPEDMERKAVSWCFKDDFICAGASGIRKNAANGHIRYAEYGVQQAAIELVQKAAPELYALERWRNGTDPGERPKPPAPHTSITQPRDFMFLVNYSGGVNDMLSTLRGATSQVMPDFVSKARYGVADFSELDGSPHYIPRINIRQNLQWLDPNATALHRTFINRLSWGTWSGGGADLADPHIMAIERLSTYSGWNPEAIKHLVLISERPMKETYTYNICNSSIRTSIGHTTYPCLTDPAQDTHTVNIHSDICDTAWQVITQVECTLGLKTPGSTYEITRTTRDALTIAQANGIAVTIVVPHRLTHPQSDFNKDATLAQLENFAKSTGGLFIEYDVFNTASYSDMMHRVLNHRPKQLLLTHQDVLTEPLNTKPTRHVLGKTSVPITFDVSQSPDIYDVYKWDYNGDGRWDETTNSPVSEHVFADPSTDGFVRVSGFAMESSDQPEASLTLPLTVEAYDGPLLAQFNSLPLPENIKARKSTDGTIRITWENARPDTIFMIADPASGTPLYSVPAEAGEFTFQPEDSGYAVLEVWLLGEAAASPRQSIAVEEEQPGTNPSGENDKTGLGESSPWSQHLQSSSSNSATQSAQNGTGEVSAESSTVLVASTSVPEPRALQQDSQLNTASPSKVLAVTSDTDFGGDTRSTNRPSYLYTLMVTIAGLVLLTSVLLAKKLYAYRHVQ